MINSLATGGGIVRDMYGSLVLAYSSSFGPGTNLDAETQALLTGLKLCKAHHIPLTQVEVDSLVLQRITQQDHKPPWHLIYWIRQIHELLPHDTQVLHTLRGANSVADALAKSAHADTQPRIFHHSYQLPNAARQALQLDSQGLGHSRL